MRAGATAPRRTHSAARGAAIWRRQPLVGGGTADAYFAGFYAALPTRAIGMTKRLFEHAYTASLDDQLALEAELRAAAPHLHHSPRDQALARAHACRRSDGL